MHASMKAWFAGAALMVAVGSALAQQPPVRVRDGVVVPPAAGQNDALVFFNVTSKETSRLVGVESAAAQSAQLQQIVGSGASAKARPVDGVALPAGRRVDFRAQGVHVVLRDLKLPVAPGSEVPITLKFAEKNGRLVEWRTVFVAGARKP